MDRLHAMQIVQETIKVQNLILKTSSDLSLEQLGATFGETAPAIGWHLWHVARWADRLQASIQVPDGGGVEVWGSDRLAERWGLPAESTGLLETGTSMAPGTTALPANVDRGELLGYATAAFNRVVTFLSEIDLADLEVVRESIKAFRVEDGTVTPARGDQTTLFTDLVFHLVHASRHLGMIEALRGLLLEKPGSASV